MTKMDYNFEAGPIRWACLFHTGRAATRMQTNSAARRSVYESDSAAGAGTARPSS